MYKDLTVAGVSLRTFGVMISGEGTYNSAARDIESVSVAGRNGDLLIDHCRYKNVSVKYPVAIPSNFSFNAADLRAFLSSLVGYQRIVDEHHPESYRMGCFVGPVAFNVGALGRYGEATLEFDCKPQRFSLDGESPVALAEAGELVNPYLYPALPIITVHGSGDGILTVGNYQVDISGIPFGAMILDSETCDAYWGTENLNPYIYAPEFPVLMPGATTISWTGGISRVEIIPRWWTL